MMTRLTLGLLGLLLHVQLVGCYGHDHQLRAKADDDAWSRGDHNAALAHANRLFARYANANPEAALALPAISQRLTAALADGVVIVAPPASVANDTRPPTHRDPEPDDTSTPRAPRPGAFDRDLASRLLSLDAPTCLSAIAVVQNMRLKRFARTLIVIIDRPDAWTDETPLTANLTTAERALAVKDAALAALRDLTRH